MTARTAESDTLVCRAVCDRTGKEVSILFEPGALPNCGDTLRIGPNTYSVTGRVYSLDEDEWTLLIVPVRRIQ